MGQRTLKHDDCVEPEDAVIRPGNRRNRIKVLVAMSFAVVLGALGDISLSHGMKEIGATDFNSIVHAFIAAVSSPYIIGGVGLLFCFLLLYLASLSWEDLSYVLPLTAADYILVTIFACFILHEGVSPLRWLGSAMVALGIYLVARS